MRKNTVVSVTLALAVLAAVTAAGQQAIIDLPLEPRHETAALTLAEAAATNNFPAFMSLYGEAADAALYGHIHELWQYSMTDPIGAFYGAGMHDRFARLYPGYSAFIADFAVVDSRGDTYYPSAETRAFLLDQVGRGVVAPEQKPLLAEVKVTPGARVSSPAPSVVPIAPEPIVLEPVVLAVAAPPRAAEASRAPSIVAPAPAPDVRVASRVVPISRPDATRGIFLSILGLLGIGMLTLMLQTPSEDEHADHVV